MFLVAGVEPVAGQHRPLLDTVLLMHVTSERTAPQVVSVPVTTWVAEAGATQASGFPSGGAEELVSTVETLSDVRGFMGVKWTRRTACCTWDAP